MRLTDKFFIYVNLTIWGVVLPVISYFNWKQTMHYTEDSKPQGKPSRDRKQQRENKRQS